MPVAGVRALGAASPLDGVTAGLGGMQTENIALEGLRLGVAALDDLDTVAALQRALR